MAEQIPLVSYLELGDTPQLVAQACDRCGARFFGRRNACAHCGGRTFTAKAVASTGKVTSFTIVHRAAPSVTVPFVSATVLLDDGVAVTANIVNTPPDPEHVVLGMPVALTTYTVGTDDNGVEAVAFGFEPLS